MAAFFSLPVLSEILILAAILTMAARHPRAGESFFHWWERHSGWLARKRISAVLFVISVALIGRLSVWHVAGVPLPDVPDEFSHLLAADTFASGRSTNPTHPKWQFFETLYVLHHPSYMSIYPPGQGMVLALGQRISGYPWVGVWLSVGLMCGVFCWALQGWVPPGWALFGGILAALRFGVFNYWMNSYWGGAVGALGGALLLGALPRLLRTQRARDALLFGLGLVILANSRPYEGFLLSFFVCGALGWGLMRKPNADRKRILLRVALPIIFTAAVGAASTGYFYWHVIGSPFRLSYMPYREATGLAPNFLWQAPQPAVEQHHKVLKDAFDQLARSHLKGRTIRGAIGRARQHVTAIWKFFFGVLWALPLVVIPFSLDNRKLRFFLLLLLLMMPALLGMTWLFPHYVSPLAVVFLFLVVQSLRILRRWCIRGEPTGKFLVRAMIPACLVLLCVRFVAGGMGLENVPDSWNPWWGSAPLTRYSRAVAAGYLERLPGLQLVFVRFRADQASHHHGWLGNRADIDAARVVWAHDMGPQANDQLIRYLPKRQVWLAEPDAVPVTIKPYPQSKER